MKYVCLVYFEETALDALGGGELDELVAESSAYDEELQGRGHLIVAQALKPVQTATTVRVRNSQMSLRDGPVADTKEQLGGFVIINASDLNEAIRLASGIPLARLGSIEVRPI